MNRGIYFLASDAVMSLAIAFLNSIRSTNPDIEICMVPYCSNFLEIAALASTYSFHVWEDLELLKRCDIVSQLFHARVSGEYRKLALWDGPFDEFIYIDLDMVVLKPISSLYLLLEHYDILTSHSHMPSIQRWVWREKPIGFLTQDQIAFSANTGFILSKSGALSFNGSVRRVQDALLLKDYMELNCAEQPLLNYLITTSGTRYSSLSQIVAQTKRNDIPREMWSGNIHENIMVNGSIAKKYCDVLAIHWAGEWKLGKHLTDPLWLYYRHLRD
jgi:hypothetical protein